MAIRDRIIDRPASDRTNIVRDERMARTAAGQSARQASQPNRYGDEIPPSYAWRGWRRDYLILLNDMPSFGSSGCTGSR
jgi:hypothetical protein